MKTSFVASLAVAFISAASALENMISTESLNTDGPFTIRAGPGAPANLTSLGNASIRMGQLGWYGNDDTASTAQLQFQGKEVYAVAGAENQSSKQLYLRPTHGTPMYYTLVGDPNSDGVPGWTETNFSIAATLSDGEDTPTYYLGGTDGSMDNWQACNYGSGWDLYYGAGNLPSCSEAMYVLIEFV